MPKPLVLALIAVVLFLAGCNPQPLPVAPTPIPTLIPATLPVEVDVEAALGGAQASPIARETAGVVEGAAASAAPDLALGERVFGSNCSVCHNLSAEFKVGPGLAGVFDKDSLPNGNAPDDAGLREWITGGGGSMPGVPLADDELAGLIAYLRDATG